MNIGIRLHDTAPGTLRERLSFARAQGFRCAHIALSKATEGFDMQNAPALLTAEYAALIRRDLDETQMDCAVLGCYLNLADPDPGQREKTQDIYRAHLRFAGMIHAGVVGTETYANPRSAFSVPASESEDAYQLFLEGLRPVVRFAEESDTILAVEPVWSHIISTPERAERMLYDVPSDHLRIILDAVNLIGPADVGHAESVIEDAVRRLGGKVSVLHMKDLILKDGRPVSVACGLGGLRYERLLSFAKARDLPMTLEDTKPDNAERARLYLESIAQSV